MSNPWRKVLSQFSSINRQVLFIVIYSSIQFLNKNKNHSLSSFLFFFFLYYFITLLILESCRLLNLVAADFCLNFICRDGLVGYCQPDFMVGQSCLTISQEEFASLPQNPSKMAMVSSTVATKPDQQRHNYANLFKSCYNELS